jgi:polyisoprenoid-binding protein YceI
MSSSNSHCEGKDRVSVMAAVTAVGRIALLSVLLLTGPATAVSADTDQMFSLDQRFGSIDFSVRNLGLFSSNGTFRRFEAQFVLNNSHPERTKISVTVDAESVDMSWHEAADMLRSVDFFDVSHYPQVRYQSTSVQETAPDHFEIHGLVRIRGVTQPLTLSAALTKQSQNLTDHSEIDDFIVYGSIMRSSFGMTTDETFISDRVNIVIKARLKLPRSFNAG